MGKKNKKQKKNSPKMSIWNKLFSPNRHNLDVNHIEGCDCGDSMSQILPSHKALIYYSELQYIARCIQDFPNIETGGQLFGAWTASGAPRVMYVIGPGPKANHQSAFFNQDVEYLETIGAKLKEYGLQHIGEWHSHHHLGLSSPSGHDAQTMENGIIQLNLNRLLLCIGCFNDKGIVINPFNFARDAHFIPAQWEVINTRNRLREVIDKDLINILCNPSSSRYTFAEEYNMTQHQTISNQSGWFSELENRQAFKQIIDELKKQTWINEVSPQISSDGIVTLKVVTRTFVERITFPTYFPKESFEIERIGVIEDSHNHYSFEEEWILMPDIQQTFKFNYNLHLKNHH